MKTIIFAAISVGVAAGLTGACSGGGCSYDEYTGTCTGEGDGLFTFEGTFAGVVVTLTGNTLSAIEAPLAAGETRACTLMDTKTGTCTPCLFDIGEAAAGAWEFCEMLPVD